MILTHIVLLYPNNKKQEMCDKAFNKYFLAFIYFPDWYKTKEMCDRDISEDPFTLVYCPDKYKT